MKKAILRAGCSALLFFVVTVPFRHFFSVMQVTEVRPASALPPVLGLLLGVPGILGCAAGNLAADIFSGYSPLLCGLGFGAQFLYGYVPYKLWYFREDKASPPRLYHSGRVMKYIAVTLADCVMMAGLLGGIMQLLGISDFFSMATLMLLLNNLVFCMVLGIPLLIWATVLKEKKSRRVITLNERFVLIFLMLSVVSAALIGGITYFELSRYQVPPLEMWNRVYGYVAMDLMVFYAITAAFLWYAQKTITVPVQGLSRIAEGYAADGQLDSASIAKQCESYIQNRSETGVLAAAFRNMALDIERYIKNLTAVTAEKERIGAELDVARHIQGSMLPCVFPAFPDREEFDIYASMTPAREVGGDFYDFFLIDGDHLALVMADVSGKGVPAALFMMITKTLIKNSALTGLSPKETLEQVNAQLCENNKAEMFVTVWLGILTISTGEIRCANAGHEYPVIKRAGGDYALLKDKHGFVLAGMENARYQEYALALEPGDKLVLYTDGVAEAANAGFTLFGTERMLASLNRHKEASCQAALQALKQDVDAFVGEAPQFDDITVLALEMRQPAPPDLPEIILAPSLEAMEEALAFARQIMEKANVPAKTATQINIVIDELFSNIIRYSGADTARFGCFADGQKVILRFCDGGVPYNPLERPDPDIALPAEERAVGGLGIYMVKKTMDSIAYDYRGAENRLTAVKKIRA